MKGNKDYNTTNEKRQRIKKKHTRMGNFIKLFFISFVYYIFFLVKFSLCKYDYLTRVFSVDRGEKSLLLGNLPRQRN